ncbi:MAG: DUF4178 domain-containing protein [Deltaproteobacteria bacterium]|nr:DUF4178 domain-containing protein [Deltaproteobacteria bacterium]
MLFFLALSALAAATFGSVVLYQRGEKRRISDGGVVDPRLLLPEKKDSGKVKAKKPGTDLPKPSEEPTLETLRQGDIVVDGDDDWLVMGTVAYREEKDTWALHALEGGSKRRFLEVRQRGGGLDVAFVDLVDGLPGGQLLHGLTFRGQSFQLDVRGDARTQVDGDVGVKVSSGGVLAWARYSGGGGSLLLVEDEGAARRAFLGSRVPPSSLSLMSGELNRQQD